MSPMYLYQIKSCPYCPFCCISKLFHQLFYLFLCKRVNLAFYSRAWKGRWSYWILLYHLWRGLPSCMMYLDSSNCSFFFYYLSKLGKPFDKPVIIYPSLMLRDYTFWRDCTCLNYYHRYPTLCPSPVML